MPCARVMPGHSSVAHGKPVVRHAPDQRSRSASDPSVRRWPASPSPKPRPSSPPGWPHRRQYRKDKPILLGVVPCRGRTASEILQQIQFWDSQVKRLADGSGGGIRVRGITPV